MDLVAMRVYEVRDVEVPDLPSRLAEAGRQSKKSITKICADAGISSSHWYKIISGKADGIPLHTLRAIEASLGIDLGIDLGGWPDP